jgi:hypothetical protein
MPITDTEALVVNQGSGNNHSLFLLQAKGLGPWLVAVVVAYQVLEIVAVLVLALAACGPAAGPFTGGRAPSGPSTGSTGEPRSTGTGSGTSTSSSPGDSTGSTTGEYSSGEESTTGEECLIVPANPTMADPGSFLCICDLVVSDPEACPLCLDIPCIDSRKRYMTPEQPIDPIDRALWELQSEALDALPDDKLALLWDRVSAAYGRREGDDDEKATRLAGLLIDTAIDAGRSAKDAGTAEHKLAHLRVCKAALECLEGREPTG